MGHKSEVKDFVRLSHGGFSGVVPLNFVAAVQKARLGENYPAGAANVSPY